MKSVPSFLMPSGSWPRRFTATGLLVVLALAGCGKNGADGTAGSSGPAGPVSETGVTSGRTLTAADNAPGVVLAVTSVTGQTGATGNFQVGDKPAVTFTVKKSDGTAWHLNEMGTGRIFLSGPTFNYQRVLPRADDLITRSVANGDGSYTYTFASGLPATYAAPYNDSATYGLADGELKGTALLAGTYTIGIATSWNYTVDGVAKKDVGNITTNILFGNTLAVAAHDVVSKENCNQCHVKVQAHGGSYQDPKMCVLCHTAGAEDANATKGGGVAGTRIDFKVMVHRIHDGAHLPSVNGVTSDPITGARVYGTASPLANTIVSSFAGAVDFSKVNFPVFPNFNVSMPRRAGYSSLSSTDKATETILLRGAAACYKCHGDADGSGPLTAPAQGALHTTEPSRRACGSCHDDIDWTKPYTANGMTMPAQADDTSCTTCHAPTGTTGIAVPGVGTVPSTPAAHVHPASDSTIVPEVSAYHNGLNVAVTTLAGGTGASSAFQAGDKPALTFTIKDKDGTNVPLYKLNTFVTSLAGPTTNRQLVFPIKTGSTNPTLPICDFSGRLVASSTTGKGSIGRVVGSTVSETLKIRFTSATAFSVTGGGSALTDLGSGTVTSPSTNPAGTTLTAIELTPAAVAQTITVGFTSATDFTVTGSVSGAMGSGTMPATVSTTNRFTSTDGTVAFTLTSGTTAFSSGKNFYLTVFKTNANGHVIPILVGSTAFAAGDRFFYETVQNELTTYTYNMPMDILQEFVGDGVSGAPAETFTAAANLPVYWGRETVYERTALAGAGQGNTTITTAIASRALSVDVASATNLAVNDYVVLDHGVAGSEEYLRIDSLTGTKVYFTTPTRFAHNATAACQEVTLTQRYEGTNYTLNPTTGVITTVTAVTAGNAVVISYRTDGAFGWKRYNGDTPQAYYPLTLMDATNPAVATNRLGQDWGKWQGLPYENGTYTAAIWGVQPIFVPKNGEYQQYSITSKSALKDFIYGSGTLKAYPLISSQNNCDSCHDGVLFHGGGRKGNDTCAMCHGIAGAEDNKAVGVTVKFSTMLHKAHMREELANASTYSVNGSVGIFKEGAFPAMPGGAKACETCHGTSNTAWKDVATRAHSAGQTTPTKNYQVVCNSCHDSTATATHTAAMTTASGAESCVTCHGPGQAFSVETVHKNR